MFRFPWSKDTRQCRGTTVEEIPHPPILEGCHRSLTAKGGGVVFQPCWGVTLPPQPPPFLTALIFLFSRSLSSSNFWFFLPFLLVVIPCGSDTKRRGSLRSVRRIHGAVTSLLLLLLLQEELLQRRRARLHHGAGPDRLQRSKAE